MRCSASTSLMTVLLLSGCTSTSPTGQNRGVAPPIPSPAPMDPLVMPPPGAGAPGMPVPPPGNAPSAGLLPAVAPNSPEQARVLTTAARLYQSSPWLTVRPRWYVAEGNVPGVGTQGDQTVILSASLVRSASDGQLAAVMSLQLGDLMCAKQRNIQEMMQSNKQRATTAPPDYYQMEPGQSSTLALLRLDEYAKIHNDPRDPRRKEQQQQQPTYDAPTCARQLLAQAGYSELELDQAAPLLQRFSPAGPGAR